jgi:hypothetical protein
MISHWSDDGKSNHTKDSGNLRECMIPLSAYDMKVDDELVIESFNKNPLNKFIDGLLSDEDKFVRIL